MGLELYAIAFTWTLLGFWPGEGLCNQTPVIVPFSLLYPYPEPLHPALLVFPDPPPLPDPPPELLAAESDPPHPVMTKT